ncbi:hypothetical protein L289_1557 [Acinetobacter gerneri DSM 14967 = CIP 107464 = MTCC 9824]|nr:hypothetical protein L289_1557 [Acinetobacter gerneri DSM 14967 = CIP 107464 = MTCC 9824]
MEPASAVPASPVELFSSTTGAFGAVRSARPVEIGSLLFPASSVAVTVPSVPSAIGFGVIDQWPVLSAVAVTVLPEASVTVTVEPASAVPLKPDELFSSTVGASGAVRSARPVDAGALTFPAASVAVTVPSVPFVIGFGVIDQLPTLSATVVTVLPEASVTVTVEPASAVPARPAALFSVTTGALGAVRSARSVDTGALSFPAASVAVTVPSVPFAIGFGVIDQWPILSAVAVTVLPEASVTVTVEPASAVPARPAALFSVTTGALGAV